MIGSLKQTVKPFWRHVHHRLKTKSRVDNLKDNAGSLYCSDQEKATLLNEFFSSVFTVECVDYIPDFDERFTGNALLDITISPDTVRTQLKRLKATGAPGPDGVHPQILREAADQLCTPLASLFQRSIDSGTLPAIWKTASVVPVYKKGDKQSPGNYRPISLTSIVCRTLEAIIRDHLMQHMTVNNLFTEAQHGFRPHRSCDTQLIEMLDDWSRYIEDGEPIDCVYLDFQKAFDSVPHKRLLKKLEGYGVHGTLLSWIRGFLSDRQQRVVINGCESPWAPVVSGVPQGSVLGPVLFLVYINDLPLEVNSKTKMFADDTKLYAPSKVAGSALRLQEDINRVTNWSDAWQLPFNTTKCTVLHVGPGNAHHQYTMRGATLQETDAEKDLGVKVDTHLKFRDHAAAAASKGNQILAVIRRSFRRIDKTTLPILYKTLVRPHLEYGNLSWGPFNRADQILLEKVQRRATRLVRSIRHLPYSERLRQLEIPSLYYRRRRGDMIRLYQIFNSAVDLEHTQLFERDTSNRTRGHPFKLLKPRADTRVRRHAFGVRSINDWNGLPAQVVTAPSTSSFKARLDTHWAASVYYCPDTD